MRAIYAHFAADPGGAFYRIVGGRLQPVRGVPGTPTPLAVFKVISDEPEHRPTELIEDCLVQFSVFLDGETASADDAYAALEALDALYDDCALSVDGHEAFYMLREASDVDNKTGPWHVRADYRVLLEKE